MIITVFFTDSGIPRINLSPKIDIWKIIGDTQVVINQDMTEIGGGSYYYDFTTYDNNEDYTIRADGGSILADYERYMYGANDSMSSKINEVWSYVGGDRLITNNREYFYDVNGDTEAVFLLLDNIGDSTMTNVYRRIKTFPL